MSDGQLTRRQLRERERLAQARAQATASGASSVESSSFAPSAASSPQPPAVPSDRPLTRRELREQERLAQPVAPRDVALPGLGREEFGVDEMPEPVAASVMLSPEAGEPVDDSLQWRVDTDEYGEPIRTRASYASASPMNRPGASSAVADRGRQGLDDVRLDRGAGVAATSTRFGAARGSAADQTDFDEALWTDNGAESQPDWLSERGAQWMGDPDDEGLDDFFDVPGEFPARPARSAVSAHLETGLTVPETDDDLPEGPRRTSARTKTQSIPTQQPTRPSIPGRGVGAHAGPAARPAPTQLPSSDADIAMPEEIDVDTALEYEVDEPIRRRESDEPSESGNLNTAIKIAAVGLGASVVGALVVAWGTLQGWFQ